MPRKRKRRGLPRVPPQLSALAAEAYVLRQLCWELVSIQQAVEQLLDPMASWFTTHMAEKAERQRERERDKAAKQPLTF